MIKRANGAVFSTALGCCWSHLTLHINRTYQQQARVLLVRPIQLKRWVGRKSRQPRLIRPVPGALKPRWNWHHHLTGNTMAISSEQAPITRVTRGILMFEGTLTGVFFTGEFCEWNLFQASGICNNFVWQTWSSPLKLCGSESSQQLRPLAPL